MSTAKAKSRANQLSVGPETLTAISYRLYDAEGQLVESSDEETVEFVFGYGQLLAGLERAIDGMTAGQTRSISLSPRDAFGKRRREALIEVDRNDLPPDLQVGDALEAETESGEALRLRVLDVQEDFAVLDTNHPLAGQTVKFDLTVESVRAATSEELREAKLLLQGAQAPLETGLIRNQRLIRNIT